MKAIELKSRMDRRSFRPFSVCLTDGAKYRFKDPKHFGTPKDYHVIVHFGGPELARIDTDTIAEIIQR